MEAYSPPRFDVGNVGGDMVWDIAGNCQEIMPQGVGHGRALAGLILQVGGGGGITLTSALSLP
jgi:hypothetical protein